MKKSKVLFVDDEPNILNGYKRLFRSIADEWELFFAVSGPEALTIMEKEEIDVIISDYVMPGMNGEQLLKKTKELYPGVIRIILSGFSEKEEVLQTSSLTHQIYTKPIDLLEVKKYLVSLLRFRKQLANKELLRTISNIDILPSNPKVYSKLYVLLRLEKVSTKSIADIISNDPIMTAKILQMVNTSYFGLANKIIDPLQAITFLGVEVVKALVLFVNIFLQYTGDHITDFNEFWEHSIKTGKLAEKISKLEGLDEKLAETAFIAGLLHDVGKLVFSRIDNYFEIVKKEVLENNLPPDEVETKIWGVSHSDVGSYLLSLWSLPADIVEIVSLHHTPEKQKENYFTPLVAVYLANALLSSTTLKIDYLNSLNLKNEISLFQEMLIGENNES